MDETRDPSTGSGAGEGTTNEPNRPDESFGWTAPDAETEPGSGNDARATAERMVAQLQSMIDSIATQAGPVVRQVGAKAAELAAVAADRAGPIAHRAADATADAGVKIAERSRTWAAELRSKPGEADSGYGGSSSAPTAVLDGADDAAERAAKDDPAEGPRE
jgi:hypothetical protein